MSKRMFMSGNPPRLITTKPGYNADDLSLQDIYKTFDSNWYEGAGIRWIFHVVIPYEGNARTSKIFSFPYPLNHVPRYSWMWGGYATSGATYPPTQGVDWPFPLDPNAPYFSTAWQATPGGGNSQTPNNRLTVYSDRFELIDTIVPGAARRGTLIVYQS